MVAISRADFLASKGYRRKFETLSNVDDWYVRTY
ncbi:MAG: hypothetical protein RL588_2474 [Pseudomonadota bacterium]|jgi:hypothetical protein